MLDHGVTTRCRMPLMEDVLLDLGPLLSESDNSEEQRETVLYKLYICGRLLVARRSFGRGMNLIKVSGFSIDCIFMRFRRF